MSQNIGRSNREDPFYRYKMPKVMAKKEGKGNGKKTVVVNIFDIGKALARPSEHPMKYLGFELGCIVNYDSKKDEYDGGTVMGWFDQDQLAEKVDDYVDDFVLCVSCGSPETVIDFDKKEVITMKCKACGATNPLPKPNHKLCNYIVKHGELIGKAAESTGLSKDERRKAKLEKQKSEASKGEEGGEGGDAIDEKAQRKLDKKAEKAAAKAAEKAAKVAKAGDALKGYKANTDGGVFEVGAGAGDAKSDDDDWGEDADADAAAARRAEFFAEEKTTTIEDEADDEQLIEILKARLEGTADKKAVVEHFQNERGLKDAVVVGFLFECAFTDDVVAEAKIFAPVLKKYCGPKAAKGDKCQVAVVLGLEDLIGASKYSDELNTAKKVPKIFEAFYDNDILSEELILVWADKGVKGRRVDKSVSKAIRANCAAFCTWLAEAEDDSD